jgi:hypothetical protein
VNRLWRSETPGPTLGHVLQRTADHVIVVVGAINGDVATASELAGRRDGHGVRLRRIEVGAGAFPVRGTTARGKLRPFSGSTSIAAAGITASTTERLVSTLARPMPPVTTTASRTGAQPSARRIGHGLPNLDTHIVSLDVSETGAAATISNAPGATFGTTKLPSGSVVTRLTRADSRAVIVTDAAGTALPRTSRTRPLMVAVVVCALQRRCCERD